MMWFFIGCIYQYGEPVVSHIEPIKKQGQVDFNPLHKELDTQLVVVSDRFGLERLKQLEQLLIKSKSWDRSAQEELYVYAKAVLEQEQKSQAESAWGGGEIQEMELQEEEIDEVPTDIESPVLKQAKALMEKGDNQAALLVLETCRDKACWSEVYVVWADLTDVLLAEKCEEILAKSISNTAKDILLQHLLQEYSSSNHKKYIEDVRARLTSSPAAP